MELKGQGAIEYLLIIGAAILVVAIVILAVTGALNNGTTGQLSTATTAEIKGNQKLQCTYDCNSLGTDCSVPASCVQFTDICKNTAGNNNACGHR